MEHLSFDCPRTIWSIFGAGELSPSVFRAIESSLDLGHFNRPLLQNLSELSFNQDFGGVSLRDVCVFLGPRLKTLNLTTPSSLDGLETLLSSQSQMSRYRAFIHIKPGSLKAGEQLCVRPYLQPVFSPNTIVRRCHLRFTDPQISFFSSLLVESQCAPSQKACTRGFLDSSSNILPFLAMRHLEVSVASIADAGEFLQVTSSSSGLESLSITFERMVPTPEQLRAVFTVMQRSSFCDTLTNLNYRTMWR
jgi:hypothetical protein